MSHLRSFAMVLALAGATAAACSDPVQSSAISALGKEVTGVPIGEFHRAGQPCLVCHEPYGPASKAVYSVAGTVFAGGPTSLVGVAGAQVHMTDSNHTSYVATTNCVGNFVVKPTEWDPNNNGSGPGFPLLVRVVKGQTTRTMKTLIGRDGSCAGCHAKTIAEDNQLIAMPHVSIYGDDPTTWPAGVVDKTCAVNPDLGTQ